MEAAPLGDEREAADGDAPGGTGGAGQAAVRPNGGARTRRPGRTGVQGRDLPLARGHHQTRLRRDSQRGEQRDARVLLAMPPVHRQHHPHLRGGADEAGVRPHDERRAGARGRSQDHRRVQPAVQVRDTHRGSDDTRPCDRGGPSGTGLVLPLLPGAGTVPRYGDDSVLLHLHRRVQVPPGGGRRDRGLHGEGVPGR